ncbi:restriction endonuclease subunit S [Clostridium sp. ATCC 25772]|uniref:restriction endonuclease subunit S n=1 Tax=Clostridium sp. ATCC 25772 TaxID=1676991 RepID=UPI000785EA64|nr:restriction endonuclease subunit S [Clostridium sp. ATCC 25772]
MGDNEKNVPKRRFKEFKNAEAWEQRKLGDVAKIVGGGTPSTGNPEYWNGDIDWYSPTEIGNHIYAKGSIKKITKLGLEKSSAKILPPDKTILFTSRAGIGDMAILKHQGATNQGFQSLVLMEEVDTYFIYSMGHLIKKYAEKNASGSTFLEIAGRTLGQMPILMPSINEQTQIGIFFKALDNTITLHQRKLDKIKALKKSYLTDMFPKEGENKPKLRFAGFTDDWEQRKLKDVSTYLNGGSFEKDVQEKGQYELITLKSVDMDGNLIHSGRYVDIEVQTLTKGTLVMILSEQSPGLLGMTAQIPIDNKYILNQRVAEIRPNKSVDSYFLSMVINKNQKYFSRCGAGTKVQNISKSNVENYEFLCPILQEQQRIGQFFETFNKIITLHQHKLQKLQNIKKAYLNEMFI